MPIDLNREEFGRLPRMQKDLVMFDNFETIKSSLEIISKAQTKQQNQINQNRAAGATWLFVLTVAVGLRNYIPFLLFTSFIL